MISQLFGGNLTPHGYCFQWRSDILVMTVIGDSLTFIAYSLIPVALIYLVRKRSDLSFNSIFYLFAAFIAFCGVTHLFNLINIWQANYFLSSLAKLATGIVSITSAYTLWRIMPKILAIPSNADLLSQNEALRAAKEEVAKVNSNLEKTVEERTKKLVILASTDQLTQVKNRRVILEVLDSEIKRVERYSNNLSILMLDLDHFKKINDEHGHLEGDVTLTNAAKVISQACRDTDVVGRYGGEEFMVVMPETSKQGAKILAERIRKNIAAFEAKNKITCSIGVASYSKGITALDLIKKADDRAYQAKERGRNLVVSD